MYTELSKHGIRNHENGKWQGLYTDVSARWHQHQLFEEFLRDLEAIQKRPKEKHLVTRMMVAHEEILFDMMRFGIKMERSDLLHEFDRGARRFYLLDAIRRIKLIIPFLRYLPIPRFVRKWASRG